MKWYADWQNPEHARLFDFRSPLDGANLIRNYEAYNDVRLLNERLNPSRGITLLEVGCATGEFCRYLRIKFPRVSYYGVDVSQPAIERAQEKYPQGRFFLTNPEVAVGSLPERVGLQRAPEIVYAKDVVHHQIRPFEFVSELLKVPSEALIMRCRTRDVGKTEPDPELSCQYAYGGWMPYIVTNLDELIAHIKGAAPQAEVVVYRNHMVLGGRHDRYLPKDCYLKDTGTAETAIGVFLTTTYPGKISVMNRLDLNPSYTLGQKVKNRLRRVLSILP